MNPAAEPTAAQMPPADASGSMMGGQTGQTGQAPARTINKDAFLKNMPADYRISITNAPGANAYPISSFTYLLIPATPINAANASTLKDMLSWIVKDGEAEASGLSYAPLPSGVQEKVLKTIYAMK